jgi:hypothetical protein
MHTSKRIDSCIELIKTMLGDTNNELTSEQRNKLKTGIHDLKLTHTEVFVVVSRIAEAALEVLNTVKSA